MSDKQYLAEHKVPELINNAIIALVDAQPKDPKRFLANYIEEQSNADTGYPDLSKHNNFLARCLTPELYNKLRAKRTSSGYTLDSAIQVGVDLLGHPFQMPTGITAGDEDSYEVFSELFDPIIELRHGGYKKTDTHKTDLDWTKLTGGDFDDRYVVTTRIRSDRNVRGYPLPPQINRSERRAVEKTLVEAAKGLTGELAGSYHGMGETSEDQQREMIKEKLLFEPPLTAEMTASRMSRDWPDARGTFHNNSKTFALWVNKSAHLRVISMQKGGSMPQVFQRFCQGAQNVEASVKRGGASFMHNERLGYLQACPSNLGSSLRASVHIKVPLMSAKKEDWNGFLKKARLQARGTGGADSVAEGGLFELSNSESLGHSEVEIVQCVVSGISKLIELEKRLESGQEVTPDIEAMPHSPYP